MLPQEERLDIAQTPLKIGNSAKRIYMMISPHEAHVLKFTLRVCECMARPCTSTQVGQRQPTHRNLSPGRELWGPFCLPLQHSEPRSNASQEHEHMRALSPATTRRIDNAFTALSPSQEAIRQTFSFMHLDIVIHTSSLHTSQVECSPNFKKESLQALTTVQELPADCPFPTLSYPFLCLYTAPICYASHTPLHI